MSKGILEKARELLKEEGLDTSAQMSSKEVFNEFILPGLKGSKDTLASIYAFKTRSRSGFLGKIKGAVQSKLINTIINTIEKQSMKQQKFNDLAFKAIELLIKENEELKEKLERKPTE